MINSLNCRNNALEWGSLRRSAHDTGKIPLGIRVAFHVWMVHNEQKPVQYFDTV